MANSKVKLISESRNKLTLQLEVDLSGSMLEVEQKILEGCNKIGCAATQKSLSRFDTDGSPIQMGNTKLTSRTQSNKSYQTPYGKVNVTRHVYQSSQGGKIYCPLEVSARIIQGGTPRMAKLLTSKYAKLNANETRNDLLDNHDCQVSVCYLQRVAEQVGTIAQAKEEVWEYAVPTDIEEPVSTISMSMDGAMVPMKDGSWREAMVGSISLYDASGERLHSIYLGASPEYGKQSFVDRFTGEVTKIKESYPKAITVGIADGASHNWSVLTPLTDYQILDFYHATEYLAEAAYGAHPEKTGKPKRSQWLAEQCHTLKHDDQGAQSVLDELIRVKRKHLKADVKEKVTDAIRYFKNHLSMMSYAHYQELGFPIGSGVTEAACKSLIKQRFCRSGMRWKEKGLKTVLSLHALVLTKNRWQQFWDYIDQYGPGVLT